MTIMREDKEVASFRMIVDGDVFIYKEKAYMRIQEIESSYDDSDCYYNAVQLETGCLEYFEGDEQIFIVDARLVIS